MRMITHYDVNGPRFLVLFCCRQILLYVRVCECVCISLWVCVCGCKCLCMCSLVCMLMCVLTSVCVRVVYARMSMCVCLCVCFYLRLCVYARGCVCLRVLHHLQRPIRILHSMQTQPHTHISRLQVVCVFVCVFVCTSVCVCMWLRVSACITSSAAANPNSSLYTNTTTHTYKPIASGGCGWGVCLCVYLRDYVAR